MQLLVETWVWNKTTWIHNLPQSTSLLQMDASLFVMHHLCLLHFCSTTCESSYHCYNPASGVCIRVCIFLISSSQLPNRISVTVITLSIAGVYECTHTHIHTNPNALHIQAGSGTGVYRLTPRCTVWFRNETSQPGGSKWSVLNSQTLLPKP